MLIIHRFRSSPRITAGAAIHGARARHEAQVLAAGHRSRRRQVGNRRGLIMRFAWGGEGGGSGSLKQRRARNGDICAATSTETHADKLVRNDIKYEFRTVPVHVMWHIVSYPWN